MPNIFIHGKGCMTVRGLSSNVSKIMDDYKADSDYRKSAGLIIEYEDPSGCPCEFEASASCLDSGNLELIEVNSETLNVVFDGSMKVNVRGACVKDLFDEECLWRITGISGPYCRVDDIIDSDLDGIEIAKKKPR